jgi:hypothetical protein
MQRCGAFQEVSHCCLVASRACKEAGRRQMARGAHGQHAVLGTEGSDLAAISSCVLEVVADDLGVFGAFGTAALLEPIGKAFVEIRAPLLRDGVVGGVADQKVEEAVGLLAGKRGSIGAN